MIPEGTLFTYLNPRDDDWASAVFRVNKTYTDNPRVISCTLIKFNIPEHIGKVILMPIRILRPIFTTTLKEL